VSSPRGRSEGGSLPGGRERSVQVGAPDAPASVPVWDAPVRVLHWTVVASLVLCWLSTIEALAAIGPWHEPVGWVGLAAVALRVVWGFVAPHRHARLASLVRAPRVVLMYARGVLDGSAPRHVGHNPLGGWMAVLLWLCIGLIALTGWLYTTDAFFGDALVEALHEAIAWAMLVLVLVHMAGAIVAGHRHGENLVAAMVHGRKRAPHPGDID
jgi:cytochrome b